MHNPVQEVPAEKAERIEAARIREAILEGYRDMLEGRVVFFRGNLRELLKKNDDGAIRL